MPLDNPEDVCSCSDGKLCYHCCKCDAGCKCGCQEKEEAEESKKA